MSLLGLHIFTGKDRMSGELNDLADEELMTAYQLGNDRAFSMLYSRYSAKVYGFLKGRLHDQGAVDDVFQATFLKLHSARSRYNASFPFAPWLFTICRNALLDFFRKKARNQEDLNEVAISLVVVEEKPEPIAVPDFSALPNTQRQALELRYGSDLPFEEIAKRLETSPANVRQLVSRAIRKLRGKINE
jgi:RNA polymerase sigma-70 factor (ECF subfamily)